MPFLRSEMAATVPERYRCCGRSLVSAPGAFTFAVVMVESRNLSKANPEEDWRTTVVLENGLNTD